MKLLNRETVYRLVPCPCYEVEACESWLTDMAAEGLFVEKLGGRWPGSAGAHPALCATG